MLAQNLPFTSQADVPFPPGAFAQPEQPQPGAARGVPTGIPACTTAPPPLQPQPSQPPFAPGNASEKAQASVAPPYAQVRPRG